MAPRPLRELLERWRSGAGSTEAAPWAGRPTEQSISESGPESNIEPSAPLAASDETVSITVTPPVFEDLNLGSYEAWLQPPRAAQRQERKMSDRLSCSAEGITEIMVETLAEDAKVRSSDEMSEILVTVSGGTRGEPALVVDGDRVQLTEGVATRIEVPEGVAVTVRDALGDLKVSRFTGDLRIRNVHGDLQVKNTTGRIDLEHVLADIRAEDVAAMHVIDCEGDFRFSGGDLDVESVNGDLRVTDAGSVHVRNIHGDMWLERLTGAVRVEATHGDVRLNDIEGAVSLGMVAGDFRATNARGPLTAGQVHGDAQLEGPFPAEEGYAVSALGDAHVRLLAEDDVRLTVRAMGRVRSNLSLTPSADGSTTYTATLGEGKVRIVLTANGDLRVEAAAGGREDMRGPGERRRGPGSDPFADLSGLGERIRQQVTASLAAAGINPETGEINMNLGFGRVRAGRGRPSEPPTPPRPPRPSGAQGAPQSGAPLTGEQLAVLKMLEEGRISAEEADSLLRALGA